ncbi:MAG: DUF2513 domain-containing protein [Rhodoferax sp.]
MKRDMDLIRAIAMAAAQTEADKPLAGLPDVNPENFAAHVQWMSEAGLLHAALAPATGLKHAQQAVVWRLTWAGCEFADAATSNTLWAKAKSKVLMPSASWTFGILLDWLKTEITQGLPKIGA